MNKKAYEMQKLVAYIIVLVVLVSVIVIFYNLFTKTSKQGGNIIDDTLKDINGTKILTPQEQRTKQVDELQIILDEADKLYDGQNFDLAMNKYEQYIKKSKEYNVAVVKKAPERIFGTILIQGDKLNTEKKWDEAVLKYDVYLNKSGDYKLKGYDLGGYQVLNTDAKSRITDILNTVLNNKKPELNPFVQMEPNQALPKYKVFLEIAKKQELDNEAYIVPLENKIKELEQKIGNPNLLG